MAPLYLHHKRVDMVCIWVAWFVQLTTYTARDFKIIFCLVNTARASNLFLTFQHCHIGTVLRVDEHSKLRQLCFFPTAFFFPRCMYRDFAGNVLGGYRKCASAYQLVKFLSRLSISFWMYSLASVAKSQQRQHCQAMDNQKPANASERSCLYRSFTRQTLRIRRK